MKVDIKKYKFQKKILSIPEITKYYSSMPDYYKFFVCSAIRSALKQFEGRRLKK